RSWFLNFQSEHVLHIVNAGRFSDGPSGGAQGAFGENGAAAGFVGEFDPFAVAGENDGVIADDVAAPEGVHADFGLRAFADETVASVTHLIAAKFARFQEDFEQAFGGS